MEEITNFQKAETIDETSISSNNPCLSCIPSHRVGHSTIFQKLAVFIYFRKTILIASKDNTFIVSTTCILLAILIISFPPIFPNPLLLS